MNPKYSAASIAVENPIFDSALCFGLCAECTNAHIMVGEKQSKGFCTHYAFHAALELDQKNPIKKCYNFYRRGQLSLFEMEKIATTIDIKQRKAGFGADTFEVLISHPKEDKDE